MGFREGQESEVDMYLWNTTKLASDLKADVVTERDKLNYLIVAAVLATFGSYALALTGVEGNKLMLVEGGVAIVVTIVGIIMCYDMNLSGDNRSFLDRFICMSLPLAIRLVVLMIVIAIPVFVVASAVAGDDFDRYLDDYTVLDVLVTVAFELIFYWRMRRHIARIAGASSEPTKPPPQLAP